MTTPQSPRGVTADPPAHYNPAMRSNAACPLAVVFFCLGSVGCGVQRTIHITSEPRGALVYLNDEEVGRTPLTVPFTFYGVYDVRLEHEGYRPLWTTHRATPPFWEYPGPDLIAAAVPGAKVRENWNFAMKPAVPPAQVNTDNLLDRARQLHQRIGGK